MSVRHGQSHLRPNVLGPKVISQGPIILQCVPLFTYNDVHCFYIYFCDVQGAGGPRALTTVTPGLGRPGCNAPQLVLGSNEGVEWWQEVDQQWKMRQRAADPSLKSPFFSLAVATLMEVMFF